MPPRSPDFARLAAHGPTDWSVRGIRRRCAQQRGHLAARAVDAAGLDAWWPGGIENPLGERGVGPWVKCYARYAHLLASTTPAGQATVDDARLQRAVRESLADTGESVTLSDGATRTVYPKSDATHAYLSDLDADIAALLVADVQLAAVASEAELDGFAFYGLRADVSQVWLWIVTTPGPGLPFDEAQPVPPVPTWIRALTTKDIADLAMAFHRVDRDTIAYLSAAFPRTPAGGPSPRLSFAGFLGSYAASKGLDPLDVTRRWSVRRVVAAALSEATTADEARRRSDRTSDAAPALPATAFAAGAR